MPRFITICIAVCIVLSFESHGQEKAFDQAAADSERVAFENTLDSLFLENNFKKVIDLCNKPHPYYLNSPCIYNLIGTYYFYDSATCWKLLNKEISRIKSYPNADAFSLADLFSEDYTSYKKFLINSTAKDYILRQIDSIYMTKPVSDKGNGKKLLHLLIEDQWIRNTSSLYDHFKTGRRHLLPSRMDSMQAIQAQHDHCTKVFEFYKTQNKVFSKAEVGRISGWQSLLFFHEWDLKRREFYHELIRKGVKDGALEPEFQANFEAGTLFIKMGAEEFFKHRAAIQENLKRKYALPDDYRIMLI